jgi:hypothetical protein
MVLYEGRGCWVFLLKRHDDNEMRMMIGALGGV